jgi:predicted DNA-binding transcriptional regulator YafY
VPATALAEELGVSKRTIHRDLETLKALGATIEGEAGVGYVLKPGFLLPPLMFTRSASLIQTSKLSRRRHSADQTFSPAGVSRKQQYFGVNENRLMAAIRWRTIHLNIIEWDSWNVCRREQAPHPSGREEDHDNSARYG